MCWPYFISEVDNRPNCLLGITYVQTFTIIEACNARDIFIPIFIPSLPLHLRFLISVDGNGGRVDNVQKD
jgi:hypothetical protein